MSDLENGYKINKFFIWILIKIYKNIKSIVLYLIVKKMLVLIIKIEKILFIVILIN